MVKEELARFISIRYVPQSGTRPYVWVDPIVKSQPPDIQLAVQLRELGLRFSLMLSEFEMLAKTYGLDDARLRAYVRRLAKESPLWSQNWNLLKRRKK